MNGSIPGDAMQPPGPPFRNGATVNQRCHLPISGPTLSDGRDCSALNRYSARALDGISWPAESACHVIEIITNTLVAAPCHLRRKPPLDVI